MTDLNFEDTRMLDVVNESDEVIDSKSRLDVHRLGLLHREIHVWMFDKENNIFFQNRGLSVFRPGLLDATVGGHLNKGEDYIEAAIRETKEETGIIIGSDDLVFLKKLRGILSPSKDYLWDDTNKFLRAVYVYKNPINERQLQKEVGIPGVSFKKLSPSVLKQMSKENIEMFDDFPLHNELPLVLKYLKEE